MTITIAERLRPFSHVPGTCCPVPNTTLVVQVFPAKVRVLNLRDIDIPLPCAMTKFTVMLDLERPSILVTGWCGKQYIRYRILSNPAKDDVVISYDKQLPAHIPFERLSLGSHKKQDWNLIQRRGDLAEILPHWFALGQLTPPFHSKAGESLLETSLYDAFCAGFGGILTPRLHDDHYHGFSLPPVIADSPFALLSEGALRIRSLFFTSEGSTASILKPQFHCGRLVNLAWPKHGTVDIEWSKNEIRRVQLRASSTATITLQFPRELGSYRLSTSIADKGRRVTCGESFEVNAGKVYTIDRFMK